MQNDIGGADRRLHTDFGPGLVWMAVVVDVCFGQHHVACHGEGFEARRRLGFNFHLTIVVCGER